MVKSKCPPPPNIFEGPPFSRTRKRGETDCVEKGERTQKRKKSRKVEKRGRDDDDDTFLPLPPFPLLLPYLFQQRTRGGAFSDDVFKQE